MANNVCKSWKIKKKCYWKCCLCPSNSHRQQIKLHPTRWHYRLITYPDSNLTVCLIISSFRCWWRRCFWIWGGKVLLVQNQAEIVATSMDISSISAKFIPNDWNWRNARVCLVISVSSCSQEERINGGLFCRTWLVKSSSNGDSYFVNTSMSVTFWKW